jgi:hypothetical protein
MSLSKWNLEVGRCGQFEENDERQPHWFQVEGQNLRRRQAEQAGAEPSMREKAGFASVPLGTILIGQTKPKSIQSKCLDLPLGGRRGMSWLVGRRN